MCSIKKISKVPRVGLPVAYLFLAASPTAGLVGLTSLRISGSSAPAGPAVSPEPRRQRFRFQSNLRSTFFDHAPSKEYSEFVSVQPALSGSDFSLSTQEPVQVVSLLTLEEETILGTCCRRFGLFNEVRLALVAGLHRDPSTVEWALASNFTLGDFDGCEVAMETAFLNEIEAGRRAKDKLVNANLRLVVSMGQYYQSIAPSIASDCASIPVA